MRVRFIAEADAAVNLDVLAGVLDRRGAGDEQGRFHLQRRIRATLVDRHRREADLIARAARRARHVRAMMLDGLKRADRPTELLEQPRPEETTSELNTQIHLK